MKYRNEPGRSPTAGSVLTKSSMRRLFASVPTVLASIPLVAFVVEMERKPLPMDFHVIVNIAEGTTILLLFGAAVPLLVRRYGRGAWSRTVLVASLTYATMMLVFLSAGEVIERRFPQLQDQEVLDAGYTRDDAESVGGILLGVVVAAGLGALCSPLWRNGFGLRDDHGGQGG